MCSPGITAAFIVSSPRSYRSSTLALIEFQEAVETELDKVKPWEPRATVHFDVRVDDVHAAEQAVLALGARRLQAERESGFGTVAEPAGEVRPGGMQRLLRRADWDVDGVRADIRAYVVDRLGTRGRCWSLTTPAS